MSQTIIASGLERVSCVAYRAVTAFERYVLHAASFILQQLADSHARYCATTVVEWYWQLHKQLSPSKAADIMEAICHSLVSLSDEQFVRFWMHLLEPQWEENAKQLAEGSDCKASHESVISSAYNRCRCVFNCLFSNEQSDRKHQRIAQTPLPSPDDRSETQHLVGIRSASRQESFREQKSSNLELGWAVEYLEQESSSLPEEMTRRMRHMMHCTIPLNLFRVKVMYGGNADDAFSELLGFVTPESLPQTPITRALQARIMNHYTVSVLDHANMALQRLE